MAISKKTEAAKSGEWVQVYTKRGSPMRGKFRWRTHREKQWEIFVAIVIIPIMVLMVVAVILLFGLT